MSEPQLAVLLRARELLSSPDKVASKVLTSEDAEGNQVDYWDARAVRHCIGHAFAIACEEHGEDNSGPSHIHYIEHGFIPHHPKLDNHSSIIHSIDAAIEALEGQ